MTLKVLRKQTNRSTTARCKGIAQPPHKPLGQKASRGASLDIFCWFAINGEGLPPENIYGDEWLESLNDTEKSSWEYRDDEDATTERCEEYQEMIAGYHKGNKKSNTLKPMRTIIISEEACYCPLDPYMANYANRSPVGPPLLA